MNRPAVRNRLQLFGVRKRAGDATAGDGESIQVGRSGEQPGATAAPTGPTQPPRPVDPSEYAMLAASPAWDGVWYARTYAGVLSPDADPLDHFLAQGAGEGFKPHPLFDIEWYVASYPEVVTRGDNPLVDYLRSGHSEGREPNPLFNSAWYLDGNPDVRDAGVNPLEHFAAYGEKEVRDPGPLFSTDSYLRGNRDVAASGMGGLSHFLEHGRGEKRPAVSLAQVTVPKVAAFATVNDYQEPYVADWLNALVRAGYDVDVYLTDSNAGPGQQPVATWVAGHLARQKPHFGVSFNGALVSDATVVPLHGRLFLLLKDHYPTAVRDGWLDVLQAATTSLTLQSQLGRSPHRTGAVHYWPLPLRQSVPLALPNARFDVLLAAPSRSTERLNDLLREVLISRSPARAAVERLIEAARQGVTPSAGALLKDEVLGDQLLSSRLRMRDLIGLLRNFATKFEIRTILRELADLRLGLLGGEGWIEELISSPNDVRAFESSSGVVTTEDLRGVYDEAKIALVVPGDSSDGVIGPEASAALVSQALFVTSQRAEPELALAFGSKVPIVVYSDMADLKRLIAHYLSHDDERREQVARVHAATAVALGFDARVAELASAVGAPKIRRLRMGSLAYRMADGV